MEAKKKDRDADKQAKKLKNEIPSRKRDIIKPLKTHLNFTVLDAYKIVRYLR